MLATRIAKQLLRGARDRRPIDAGVRILTYHGVIEKRIDPRVEAGFHLLAEFRSHVSLLRRCHVVPLADLEAARRERFRMPAVAITFDDGFHNNLVAAEILHAAKLPATIFVATENISRRQTIWPTLLRLVLARGSARIVVLDDVAYELDGDRDAFGRVRELLKNSPAAKRDELWAQLIGQLRSGELAELMAAFPSISMMSWSEVASLATRGIEIGSHGALHELHHAAQARELRLHELASSKARIEKELGRPCRAFAYPNGTFVPSSPEEVRSCGYELGFTMFSSAAGRSADAMLLPRLVPGAGLEKLVSSLVFGN